MKLGGAKSQLPLKAAKATLKRPERVFNRSGLLNCRSAQISRFAAANKPTAPITALARYEKITKEEQGTPGEPGFQPKESIIGLLIGTAPDGALLLLEISPLADSGALLASKMSHYALEGFETPVVG